MQLRRGALASCLLLLALAPVALRPSGDPSAGGSGSVPEASGSPRAAGRTVVVDEVGTLPGSPSALVRSTPRGELDLGTVDDPAPYVADGLMVAPPDGMTLEELASRAGAVIVQPVGQSGYGVLQVASADDATDTLAELGAKVARLGRIVGASTPAAPTTALPVQWHMARLGTLPTLSNPASYKVAVLDTGVAYETAGRFVKAPGLATVPFFAPKDLIENDGHPNDDQQHGTHIASLIASRSTQYPGVAPGVTLIPVKVLNAQNVGTEWALVEGIYHSITNGAKVINMSLSFPLGYVPSPVLQDALEAASVANIVMVAAAGNQGSNELTWPAASRLVIAVGAARWYNGQDKTVQTTYSNRGPKVDVMAPGGDLAFDDNKDGWPDGIVGETINPADPSKLGYWFFQGTSQAAALTTGAVVRLLANGVTAADMAATLQQSDGGYQPNQGLSDGLWGEYLNVGTALANKKADERVYVGLLPYVMGTATEPDPRARVSAVDAAGAPLVGVTVVATMYTDQQVDWRLCKTGNDGVCTLTAVKKLTPASSWLFRVDAVVSGTAARRPSRAMFATDGAAVLMSAIARSSEPSDLLAVYWPAGTDPVLGTLQESWAIVDNGTGLLSSPLGVVFLPKAVATTGTFGTLTLDPAGTGLLSSPMGVFTAKTLTLNGGSGLLSSPLGVTVTLVGLSGSGLLSSPLGFHATNLYALGGSGLLSSPLGLGYTGNALLMGTSSMAGGSIVGTPFEPLVTSERGIRSSVGVEPASWAAASGVIDAGVSFASGLTLPSSTEAGLELEACEEWVPTASVDDTGAVVEDTGVDTGIAADAP